MLHSQAHQYFAVILAVILGGNTNPAFAQTPVKVAPKADPAERAYASGYKRILINFSDTLKKIETQPDPIFPPGSTRSQKRDIVARRDDAVVVAASAAYKEMSALKPTPNFRAIHQATLDLFVAHRDTHKAYAAAFRDGDRKKVEAAWKAIGEKTKSAYRKMKEAVANTRGRNGSLPKRRKSGAE